MFLDKNFLLQLDAQQQIEKFARVTLLTNKELPIERIEGRITSSGSINIDGNSAVRRSCSLTMISQDSNFHEHYWTVKSKFKLEIGIRNTISSKYPDIIWFPQGIYVFTSFSASRSVNNFTISLQGKDKGCLINGELSGVFNSSVDLGTIENIDEEGNSTITKLELKEILINMMHEYAGEPFRNIIINDLDEQGFELLEYRYDKDLFLYRKSNSSIYENMFFADIAPDFYYQGKKVDFKTQEEGFETLIEAFEEAETEPYDFYFRDTPQTTYRIAKIQYGQTGGYRLTNLVYAGDLTVSAGNTITSVLDKIKNMLGQYEYFYDIEGRFVFQKKKYYANVPIGSNENIDEENVLFQEEVAYTFNGLELISSFNSNPNLSNLKNDFSIWGERKSISGVNPPIHLRYAIDQKPFEYTTISVSAEEVADYNEKYGTNLSGQVSTTYIAENQYHKTGTIVKCDWREIIYRMALDHYYYGFLDNFEIKIIEANKTLYPTGMTGYEQYYTDLLGYWRDLYFPEIFKYDSQLKEKEKLLLQAENDFKKATSGAEKEIAKQNIVKYKAEIKAIDNKIQDKEVKNYFTNGWNKNKDSAPDLLNFWFDFLDTDASVDSYSVKQIGSRAKVINDNSIKAIYFRKTPDVIFDSKIENVNTISGYRYLQVPGLDTMFAPSAQGRSAKEELDDLLYYHLFTADSVTIQAKPIYYLEPNTKIRIKSSGDYIISRLSIPLTYNGTMSITATKAVKNIF